MLDAERFAVFVQRSGAEYPQASQTAPGAARRVMGPTHDASPDPNPVQVAPDLPTVGATHVEYSKDGATTHWRCCPTPACGGGVEFTGAQQNRHRHGAAGQAALTVPWSTPPLYSWSWSSTAA